MEYNTASPLSTVQQSVANALAAGASISDAAEAYGVNRVTVYRWMKNLPQFAAALHQGRADFVLSRRDDLHYLSNRAIETLIAIIDNPRASPSVLLKASMFILQRPQVPKTGWTMPEPAPNPDGEVLVDSAVIESHYANLPGVYGIEREEDTPAPPQPEAAPDPPAAAPPAETPCNNMQHKSSVLADVAPAPKIPPQASTVSRQALDEIAKIQAECNARLEEFRQQRIEARETARRNAAKRFT